MSLRAFKAPSSRLVIGVTVCAVLIPVRMGRAQVQLTRLVGTGDPAPGLPGVEIATIYRPPQIDNQGNIFAWVRLQGDGVTPFNDFATLYGRPGSFSLMFRAGDPAPGLEPLVIFPGLISPALSLSGHLGYSAKVWDGADMSTIQAGVWSGPPGDVRLVGASTHPAPEIGDPNVHLGGVNPLLYAGVGGHLGVRWPLVGPAVGEDEDMAVWVQEAPGGAFRLVAREGHQAPGLEPGVYFSSSTLLSSNLAVNSRGAAAFSAFVNGPGVTADNNQAVWSGRPGELTVTVRKGDPAPQAGPDVSFNGFGGLWMNGSGDQYFRSALSGPAVTQDNDTALWVGQRGDIRLLAREGDPAPGKPANVVFGSFVGDDLGETGLALASADLRGAGIDETNDQAFWLGRPGQLELLIAEDEPPGGVEPGVAFDFDYAAVRDAFLNGRDDVILATSLRGPGIDDSNDEGIWARNHATGEWMLIVRDGELLDGRVIDRAGFNFTFNPGGRPFNDYAVFVFTAHFTDGTSGVYAAQVPEPATAWIVVTGAIFARRASRREKRRVTALATAPARAGARE